MELTQQPSSTATSPPPLKPFPYTSTPTTRSREISSTTPPLWSAPIPPWIVYNVYDAGKTRKDPLGILNLTGNVTEQEVKAQHRIISRILNPYKHRPDSTGMSPTQTEEYFKLVNNT